jgi:bacillithiol biosynthesis cysteine-adding enzyme BshC
LRIAPVSIKYKSPLVNKYLHSFDEIGHLFEYNPFEAASFINRYQSVMREYNANRQELVRILTEYNEKLGCGEKTLENLWKLADPRTVTVITGQQAGVFTGPLYTIYKTITTICLAEEKSRELGQIVVPVFWVAAEDHDYAEVDHLEFIGREQELVKLQLDYKPQGKYSIGHIPVTEAVFKIIEQLDANTNPSEWKGEIIQKLRELAETNDNLADWFAAIMAWLFQNHGLILVNPLNKELRKLWSKTFVSFLEKSEHVNTKLRSAMDKVRALGVEPQVDVPENNVNLFFYVEGERLPLLKSDDSYSVRGAEGHWSREDLKKIAISSPEMISPNVVLRPVAQDLLFPILAYVAGPGEISYYALYREIYPLFSCTMPIIYPRTNVTIIERGIAGNMEKYGVKFTDGGDGIRRKLAENLEALDKIGIETLFAKHRLDIKTSFENLINKIAELDKELMVHGKENQNRILHQIEQYEKKARQYHRKSCEQIIKRFSVMENTLFPHKNYQERVFNIFPLLFKYGLHFIGQLTVLPLIKGTEHKIVHIGDG